MARADPRALEDRIRARWHDLPPVVAAGPLGIHRVEAVGRRVEVGAHEEPSVRHLALERRGQVLRHRHRWCARVQILEIEVGLVERSGNDDHQPPPVGRDPDARPVLLLRGLEDQRISGRIGAEAMEADRAVIGLLTLGYLTRRGITGVVEARAVLQPRQVGGARVGDAVGKDLAGIHVHHVEHALLAAVLGDAVGQQPSVVAGIVPVEGDRPARRRARWGR